MCVNKIIFRMTPTIQCFDDHSVQIPSAEVQYDNIFFQEYHQMSQSDRVNSGKINFYV